MSLLTEKQIVELVEMASVPIYLYDKICEWNKKQRSFIEPNWNRLPSKIKYCHLRHYYFDDIGNEIDFEFIINFERPVTPHPHAEIMAKYAEVAARRVDPWVEFEVRCEVKGWTRCGGFNGFHSDFEYRHIGDNK